MLENMKSKIDSAKQRRIDKKLAKAKREEERIKEELASYEAERERLIRLGDKEQMAELILAVRGFYQEVSYLEMRIDELQDEIDNLYFSKADASHN